MVFECVIGSGCSDAASCSQDIACGPTFDTVPEASELLDCIDACPDCRLGATCIEGAGCVATTGQAGLCMGGQCDPSYGDSTCVEGNACSGAPGSPSGLGICVNAQCVQCSGAPDTFDDTCMNNVGGILLCCSASYTCVPCPASMGTCTDGVLNGAETDMDCGGPDCSTCSDGANCTASSDCQSGGCTAGACSPGTCPAGFEDCDLAPINGCETDVASDANNCGSCGQICPSGSCSGAACDP